MALREGSPFRSFQLKTIVGILMLGSSKWFRKRAERPRIGYSNNELSHDLLSRKVGRSGRRYELDRPYIGPRHGDRDLKARAPFAYDSCGHSDNLDAGQGFGGSRPQVDS